MKPPITRKRADRSHSKHAWMLFSYGLTGLGILAFSGASGMMLGVFALSACLIPGIYLFTMRNAAKGSGVLPEGVPASLFDHNPIAISVFDREGRLVSVNAMASRMTGMREEELLGKEFGSLITYEFEGRESVLRSMESNGQPQTMEGAMYHKDGYKVDLGLTLIPVIDEGENNGFVLISQDISEKKRTEERIRYMAYYDDMTGIPNRRLFRERLNAALAEASESAGSLAVFFIDIDRFKLVNDSFGHDYGDMLLMQAAERFVSCAGPNDLVARTEGDEFAAFFTGVSTNEELLRTADALAKALEQPFMVNEIQLHLSVSIGMAGSSGDGSSLEPVDADALMKNADIALSRAKEKGKNNFQIFNQDMKTVSLQRLTLENELRKAIRNDEFELYYQPQMDIESGRTVGVEALIRWVHPVRGLISPGLFIPVAEESGLIVPIGEWVIREACLECKKWQELGLGAIPVSVNLSMRQFLQMNLSDRIAAILKESKLDPMFLELEITESMTMDVDTAFHSLQQLKALGVQISIDDFGTGYSSLSYLKRFPIDKLKIDQSFVRDIKSDPNDAAIVATIISMAHHLNMKAIAEGVETEDQLTFLKHNRCNQVQGYFYSPPVEAGLLRGLLQKESLQGLLG